MTAPANWRNDAACRNADPELFFPVGTAGPASRQTLEAKRLCRSCPVQIPCLAWALEHRVSDGVWGGTTEDERRASRGRTRKTRITQEMTMAKVITQQSTENMEYVRKLLRQKIPAFSAALELAADLVAQELSSPLAGGRHQRFPGPTTGNLTPPPAAENVVRAIASRPSGGFARDFATADGERVVIVALNQRQFTDLAKATRLAGTFAFAERLLHADFSDRGDLYTHRDTIAALLAAWFARRTVADLAAVFGGTSVPWARLQNLTGRPGARH